MSEPGASRAEGRKARKGKRRGSGASSASLASKASASSNKLVHVPPPSTASPTQEEWISDMNEGLSTDASAEDSLPRSSHLARLNGGLRKTRSRMSLNRAKQDGSTSANRLGGFFSSILAGTPPKSGSNIASPASGSPSSLRSPTKRANGAFDRMFDKAVSYLFDPEAVNDNHEDDIWLMGLKHAPVAADDRRSNDQAPPKWPEPFLRDFETRIACTYRTQFEAIPFVPSGMTSMLNSLSVSIGRAPRDGLSSDTGWGCMLRTGQSLLANALLHVHLGRDWRRSSSEVTDPTYARLVSMFLDSPSALCPFSIHRFALMGKQLGKEVGEWFGPSTAAGAIKALVNNYESVGMRVVNFVDGSIYKSEVHNASREWTIPVLIVMGLRLGINGINPIYHRSVLSLFELPQSVGIAGGRPSSSFYFVAAQGNSLFYIDPHHAQPAVPVREPPTAELAQACQDAPLSPTHSTSEVDAFYSTAYPHASLDSYHVSRIRKTPIDSLDPSMLVGFLIRSAQDWDDFVTQVAEKRIDDPKNGGILVIQDSPPAWMMSSGGSSAHSSGPPPRARSASSTAAEDDFEDLANERVDMSERAEDVVNDGHDEVESLDSWVDEPPNAARHARDQLNSNEPRYVDPRPSDKPATVDDVVLVSTLSPQ